MCRESTTTQHWIRKDQESTEECKKEDAKFENVHHGEIESQMKTPIDDELNSQELVPKVASNRFQLLDLPRG